MYCTVPAFQISTWGIRINGNKIAKGFVIIRWLPDKRIVAGFKCAMNQKYLLENLKWIL